MTSEARLLVIDDSLTIRTLVEIAFRDADIPLVLDFAPTGAEGIQRALAVVPTVILLDYILPDMRGTDVCARLAEEASTRELPIIVMTAKSAEVREQFTKYPAVADFMTKPFAADDVVRRVSRLLGRRTHTSPGTARPGQVVDQESAALATYAVLRPGLARIPEWYAALGDKPASAYFGRKILTSSVVEGLVRALVPFVSPAAPALVVPTAAASTGAEHRLMGQLAVLPFESLMDAVAKAQHTGEVVVVHDDEEIVLYFHAGTLLLATCNAPSRYAASAEAELRGLPRVAVADAEFTQRSTGRPLFIALAEGGQLRADAVQGLVRRATIDIVHRIMDLSSGSFAWRQPAPLPLWVEPFASRLSILQIHLERMRASDSAGVHLPTSAIVERAVGFTRRVTLLELTADEARLMSLVDDRTPAGTIVQKAALPAAHGLRILARLTAIGLVHVRGGTDARGPVLIWDPDQDGVVTPLSRHLRNRSPFPLALRACANQAELLAAVARERPSLCIVDATSGGEEALGCAEALSNHQERGHFALLALVDFLEPARHQALSAAGFDRIAPKPIHFVEIERLLRD